MASYKYTKTIRTWLIIGLVMLVGQVILGGITRLTGSGLSITRWDIVSGVIPPLNKQQWQETFNLYKQTPQFHKINANFTLADFKFIYFWEYVHRLWVRILGFVFLIPFITFLIRKQINSYLIKKLAVVILFTALTASAGWIMVKSGLVDRPWVNAYKLSLHFILAVLSIAAMTTTIADVYNYRNPTDCKPKTKLVKLLIITTFFQLIFAGLMSGMKAGLYFPTWPDMNSTFIPNVLLVFENWTWHNLTNYDTFTFAPALIQFIHRLLAYILLPLTFYVYFKYNSNATKRSKNWLLFNVVLITLQLTLGILTLLNIEVSIPLFYGVAHQLVGILFSISVLFTYFSMRKQ